MKTDTARYTIRTLERRKSSRKLEWIGHHFCQAGFGFVGENFMGGWILGTIGVTLMMNEKSLYIVSARQ